MINFINGDECVGRDQPISKHCVVYALTDVLGQVPGHLHGVDEVRGLFQDGVVGHEVGGANTRVVRIQVDCSAVGCVATARGGAGEGGERQESCAAAASGTAGGAIELPFSTLDVGVVRQKHGQEVHEVVSLWPLLATGCHGAAPYAERTDNCNNNVRKP